MTGSKPGPLLLIVGTISGWVLVRSLFVLLSVPVTSPPLMGFDDAALPALVPLWPIVSGLPLDERAAPPLPSQQQSPALLTRTTGRADPFRSLVPPAIVREALPIHSHRDDQIVAAQSVLLARMQALRPYVARPLGYGGPALVTEGRLPAFIPARRAADDRWSLSAGLYVRRGTGGPTLGSGLPLGGTQAWARLGWQPGAAGTEIFARANSAGRLGNAAEAAIGVAVRPRAGLPVQLVAERRQRIGGDGRSAFAAYVVGGTGTERGGWQFNSYGAAGVVGAARRDAFAEGSATINRPVARIGALELAAGGGAWGAAQPGVSRVDIGPILTARSERLDGAQLAVDWRQRVVGNGAPDSGPALTLSLNF